MIRTGWHMIWGEKGRLAITLAGIGVTVLLMLFLLGIYQGVKQGATSYLVRCRADLWLAQSSTTNLIRNSSFLPASIVGEAARTQGVDSATGILRMMVAARVRGELVTLIIIGYDPASAMGAPATVVSGSTQLTPGQIILDEAFCRKNAIGIGDSVEIHGRAFAVSAICTESNAIVAQFAFTTLGDAQSILGFPGIVSFVLIRSDGRVPADSLRQRLEQRFPEVAAFTKEAFAANTLNEMQKGLLPVLWTIAFFGMIVGATVITLMLYGAVIEKREDFALLKALGTSQTHLVVLVLSQSIIGTLAGALLGTVLTAAAVPLLFRFAPDVIVSFTFGAWAAVCGASILIGAAGAWIPIHKLGRIYPAEVFRA